MNADPARVHEATSLFLRGVSNVLGARGYRANDINGQAFHISGNRFLITNFSMEATRAIVFRFRDSEWCSMVIRVECAAINSELADSAGLRGRACNPEPLSLTESAYISEYGCVMPPAIAAPAAVPSLLPATQDGSASSSAAGTGAVP